VFSPDHPYHSLLLRFVEIHRDRILTGAALTAHELDAAVHRLGTHLADPSTYTLYATLFQAWGRKATTHASRRDRPVR
jgi:hypothetical protein